MQAVAPSGSLFGKWLDTIYFFLVWLVRTAEERAGHVDDHSKITLFFTVAFAALFAPVYAPLCLWIKSPYTAVFTAVLFAVCLLTLRDMVSTKRTGMASWLVSVGYPVQCMLAYWLFGGNLWSVGVPFYIFMGI